MRDFSNVFPEDLFGLPSESDINFAIDLVFYDGPI